MKILIINPPRRYYKESQQLIPSIPVGLLHIASVLEKDKQEVALFDALAKSEVREEGALKYVGSFKQLRQCVESVKPDVIGIGIEFTAQALDAIKTANLVKKIDEKIIVIVGGPDVTVRGEYLLKENKSIDIGVVGEGEITISEVIGSLENHISLEKVKGVFFRKDGRIVFTGQREFIKNLDDLPLPAYHLLDMKSYLEKNEMSIITSRGCPFNCVFCSIHLHMGRRWRAQSVEYVIKHLELLVNKYHVRHIHIVDDNASCNVDRFKKILDEIIKRELKFTWDTSSGIRADTLNEELVMRMKKAGCTGLMIGVESGDQEVLNKIIDKKLDLKNVINAARLCKKYRIPLSASFVIGFPGETRQNIMKTINFALMLKKKFNVNGGFLICAPLFKTRLYELCKRDNLFVEEPTPEAFSKYQKGMINTKELTADEIYELKCYAVKKMMDAKIIYYLKHPIFTAKVMASNRENIMPFVKSILYNK